jgi:hypothetical protein
MTLDGLREFEELVEDAIARGETLVSFHQYLSGIIAGKELHAMRPELGVGEVVEDIRKFLWEEKRK